MIPQIGLGAALILLTVVTHALATYVAIHFVLEAEVEKWPLNEIWTITLLISLVVLVMVAAAMLEALLWAGTYLAVGAFSALEPALYFSLVTFTTLGFGDLVLAPPWRILAAMEAINGVVMFGWTTALLFWMLQQLVRKSRHRER